MPMPMSLRNAVSPVANPITTTISSSAAEVMMRPVRCRPVATAVGLSAPRSHSSRIRDSRNTS